MQKRQVQIVVVEKVSEVTMFIYDTEVGIGEIKRKKTLINGKYLGVNPRQKFDLIIISRIESGF